MKTIIPITVLYICVYVRFFVNTNLIIIGINK